MYDAMKRHEGLAALGRVRGMLLRCLARAIGLWEKVKRQVPVTFLRVVRDFLLRAWCSSAQVALA
jgi:hypothetical protein